MKLQLLLIINSLSIAISFETISGAIPYVHGTRYKNSSYNRKKHVLRNFVGQLKSMHTWSSDWNAMPVSILTLPQYH